MLFTPMLFVSLERMFTLLRRFKPIFNYTRLYISLVRYI